MEHTQNKPIRFSVFLIAIVLLLICFTMLLVACNYNKIQNDFKNDTGNTSNSTDTDKTIKTYCATFYLDDENTFYTSVYSSDKLISFPDSPSKSGYNFKGWRLDDSRQAITLNELRELIKDADVTLYAIWQQVYAINYELNGGMFDNEEVRDTWISDTPLSLADPIRQGYDFCGWFDNEDFLGETITTIEIAPFDSEIYLYAKWKPKRIKLSLDANGGKLTQNEVYINYNEEYQLPIPSANEDEFRGWYYQDIQLTTFDGHSINNLAFDTDIMLTAQYEVFTGSRGIEYSHTKDGYIITGIGTCMDSVLIFPEMYNGEPVVEIKREAFRANTNIYQITLSKTIKIIGAYSFAKCSNLQRVTIPSGSELQRIVDYAFWGTNLTYINLENAQKLYNINWYAFCNCKMRTIIIPKSVTHMGSRVFIGCANLKTIYCEISSKPENWNNYWLGGSPSSSDDSKIDATVIWGYKS